MENFCLTPAEAAIVSSPTVIELKNSAIDKVMGLMGQLQEVLAAYDRTTDFPFDPEWVLQGGKISKGEQYKQLPWVMLDYPRYFNKSAVFAFRTMFWWGHYFSCTLHLAGTVKVRFSDALVNGYEKLALAGFQVYVQEDPWEHDFENGNYSLIGEMTFEDWKRLVGRHDFIKLAKPFALEQWGEIITAIAEAYAALLSLLHVKRCN
ncbi:hypothetical protein [Chitinophaga nivalis]|uniref:Uncharacterized protein n=1 Tax=Chitinophaga nivalis TaxID=2991709 RepID=A0ABT3IWV4_9BACT|nr:hypothetical protein [Chitinophaga nivalis]MCW3461845.1 hypothetical protein [Chitinophaga nivalis]MCW3488461.1 hypothetical protein [Chitinophaga nivalis]